MPWWGIASSVVAPVLLVGGWTVAADLQPEPFNAVTRSISTLAAIGTPDRWVVTFAILGVGACNILTGVALRPAAEAGRILLIFGGVFGLLIAANPQPRHGGSLLHESFSLLGVVVMTLWPIAAARQEPGAPFGLRPAVARAAVAVNLVLLVWFAAELFNGPELGLAERTVTVDQAVWPLVVVLTVGAARFRATVPAEQEEAVRSQ